MTSVPSFANRAQAQAATIDPAADFIWVEGYAAAGDGGQALWRRVGAGPATAYRFQSADSAWWEYSEALINAKAFGARGDGVADDTAPLNNFFTAVVYFKRTGYLPAASAYYKITGPIVLSGIGCRVQGDGADVTQIKASGNFSEVIRCDATAAAWSFNDLMVVTTGTTTRGVNGVNGSQAINWTRCRFKGDLNGELVYSQASGYYDFDNCRWDCDGANTTGLVLDMFNQGVRVHSASRFGGIGNGAEIRRSGGSARVEGVQFDTAQFITTGATSLLIGDSYFTQVTGCNIDQASTSCVVVGANADHIVITASWLGLAAGSAGVCLQFNPTAGKGHVIAGNVFQGGSTAIGFSATAAVRVSQVVIDGNVFSNHSSVTISMDSVDRARITNNVDQATPVNGSWLTAGTFGAGSYKFDNNDWHTAAPALFHAASTYRFGNDSGLVGRNKGVNQPTAATMTLTVAHGMFRAPSSVRITPEGLAGTFYISNITASTFAVNWTTSGTPKWHWSAEV